MATRKRKRPSKAGQRESNVQAFSVREFLTEFPTDDACLRHVMEVRYGLSHVCRKCGHELYIPQANWNADFLLRPLR